MDSRLEGWRAILILIAFFATNLVVVFPIRMTVPIIISRSLRDILAHARIISKTAEDAAWCLSFDYRSVPVIAVLFLWATTAIDSKVIRYGIIGTDGIQPLDIMALFISLAYLSISLDATGLLRYLAVWVTRKGGSSGRRLYFYLYLFFFGTGVVIGNDPVILSGTAFLAYFTRMTGIIPPTAWIYSQFSAANLASAVLVSSNPTNLVISGAFSIPYTSYIAFLIIPTLFSAIFLYPALVLLFTLQGRRRRVVFIPDTIALPDSEFGNDLGRNLLVDKTGAIVGTVLLLTTLVVLVATSPLKPTIPVWMVTMPGAVLMLLRDILADRKRWTQKDIPATTERFELQEPISSRVDEKPDTSASTPEERGADTLGIEETNQSTSAGSLTATPTDELTHPSPNPSFTLLGQLSKLTRSTETYLPTSLTVLRSLPLPLIPFAFSMFILVQGLANSGWVNVFAEWWTAIQDRCGVAGGVFVMILLSSSLCNICGTNIGTTILIARTLQQSLQDSSTSITPRTNPLIFALAFGTNIGAFTFTFSASLAGLLWRCILRQKGITVKLQEFAALNSLLWIVAAIVGSTTLVVQYKVVK